MKEVTGKRKEILDLIAQGKYTKKEISDRVEVKPAGVSSQMTYLRWMGYNIEIIDGVYKVLTDEEALAFAASKPPKKSNGSKGHPIYKAWRALKTRAKAQESFAKLQEIELPEDTVDIFIDEHNAKMVILEARIYRNNIILENLSDADVEVASEVFENDGVINLDGTIEGAPDVPDVPDVDEALKPNDPDNDPDDLI